MLLVQLKTCLVIVFKHRRSSPRLVFWSLDETGYHSILMCLLIWKKKKENIKVYESVCLVANCATSVPSESDRPTEQQQSWPKCLQMCDITTRGGWLSGCRWLTRSSSWSPSHISCCLWSGSWMTWLCRCSSPLYSGTSWACGSQTSTMTHIQRRRNENMRNVLYINLLLGR